MLEAGRAALRYNLSLGITAWMDPAANAAPGEPLFDFKPTAQTLGILPVYKAMAEKGELTAHVAALLVAHPKSRPADLETLEQVRRQFQGVPNLSLPGIKIFADGVPEYPAQTAALLEPYKNSKVRRVADRPIALRRAGQRGGRPWLAGARARHR